MPKNIIICCDGTNNQLSGDLTNVVRLYRSAVRDEHQVLFYDPGVGTMPAPWEVTKFQKRWSLICGLAFGTGLMENIQDAYRTLMQAYEPGDQIYLFGFSRGAYTARCLAGMIHSVGLLLPGNDSLVPYALQYWRKDKGGPENAGVKVCQDFKATMARPVTIHFLGVWDTVGSVGLINNFKTFPHTMRNPSVKIVRHAVAIDEKRKCFRQNMMMPPRKPDPNPSGNVTQTPEEKPTYDIKNVWFAGVHADVGGGYARNESGLAKIAFEWIAREAEKAGLRLDPVRFAAELSKDALPDSSAAAHESLAGWWWLVELIPTKRYSFQDKKWHWHWFEIARRRTVRVNQNEPWIKVHSSVAKRFESVPSYRPSNLPATKEELEKKFTIEP